MYDNKFCKNKNEKNDRETYLRNREKLREYELNQVEIRNVYGAKDYNSNIKSKKLCNNSTNKSSELLGITNHKRNIMKTPILSCNNRTAQVNFGNRANPVTRKIDNKVKDLKKKIKSLDDEKKQLKSTVTYLENQKKNEQYKIKKRIPEQTAFFSEKKNKYEKGKIATEQFVNDIKECGNSREKLEKRFTRRFAGDLE